MRTQIIIESAVSFLKPLEALKLNAYLCPAGKWTIGYGSTYHNDGTPVLPSDEISANEAEEMLYSKVRTILAMLTAIHGYNLQDNQYSALITLVYNIGFANYKKSSLCKAIKKGNYTKAEIQHLFMLWNKFTKNGKKVTSPGLTVRRISEAALFNM